MAPRPRKGTRRLALPRVTDLTESAWLLALAIAVIYIVAFVVLYPSNIALLSWEPEVSAGLVMAETLAHAHSGFVVMGSTGQWVPLWAAEITAWLPFHHDLWNALATLSFAATALIVGRSVTRLAGRRAGALAVFIGLVVSPLALAFFMGFWAHNTVYPCTALLGAYLIWLTRDDGRRRLLTFAIPPILGIVIGACVASDLLVAATAVIPLGLTALLAGVRRERRSRRVALSALCTVAVTVPVAIYISHMMVSLKYVKLPTPILIASLSELPGRAVLLFNGLQVLFNGYLASERPGTLNAVLGVSCDIVMSAALLALVAYGTRTAVGFFRSGLRRSDAESPERLARSLHVVYWIASAASVCGAFWIAGEGPTTTHYSYYATVIFSLAAVLPLALASKARARWLVPAGASIVFAASFVGLLRKDFELQGHLSHYAPMIVKRAEAAHVQIGYTNWVDAYGLTWDTRNRVIVRPVVECANPSNGAPLCPGFQAFIQSWYVPQPRRSFLLVNTEGFQIRQLPPGLGEPLAQYSFGAMRMYVYPYDIATRLGPG